MEKYLNQKVIIRNVIKGVLISINEKDNQVKVLVNGKEEEYSILAFANGSIIFEDASLNRSASKDFEKLLTK